ncbi:transposase [Streptomyces flaveolus]|uniref:transposase n=1 Tax=Streptomyces flaveolus TaxID=67297 RepID=UPI003F577A89
MPGQGPVNHLSHVTRPGVCRKGSLPQTLRRPRDLPADPAGDNLRRRVFCHLAQHRGILNTHLTAGMRHYIADRDWLTVFHLPPYTPDLNPVEGIWSVLRRTTVANRAFADPDDLITAVRGGLRQLQYRHDVLGGYLTCTGLRRQPPRHHAFSVAAESLPAAQRFTTICVICERHFGLWPHRDPVSGDATFLKIAGTGSATCRQSHVPSGRELCRCVTRRSRTQFARSKSP